MNKRIALIGLLALCAVPAASYADGNANFIFGIRQFDENDWDPVEDQGVFGVDVDFGEPEWPIGLDIGFHVSSAEEDLVNNFFFLGDVDLKVTVSEVSFGVLKTWKTGKGEVRPFLGGGGSVIKLEAEFDSTGIGNDFDEDDTTFALYGRGGVYWRIGSRFNIGVDARFLGGNDFEIEGIDFDASYFQVGLLLGWGWPAE